MMNHLEFMKQFRGYPSWDIETRDEALKIVLDAYAKEYQLITNIPEVISDIKKTIETDIQHYLYLEEYEICTLLRDLKQDLLD